MPVIRLALLVLALGLAGCVTPPLTESGAADSSAAISGQTDGGSFEQAVVVQADNERTGVDAEYVWIKQHFPGARVTHQSLVPRGKQVYDVIHIVLADGTDRDVYFDITSFFGKF